MNIHTSYVLDKQKKLNLLQSGCDVSYRLQTMNMTTAI